MNSSVESLDQNRKSTSRALVAEFNKCISSFEAMRSQAIESQNLPKDQMQSTVASCSTCFSPEQKDLPSYDGQQLTSQLECHFEEMTDIARRSLSFLLAFDLHRGKLEEDYEGLSVQLFEESQKLIHEETQKRKIAELETQRLQRQNEESKVIIESLKAQLDSLRDIIRRHEEESPIKIAADPVENSEKASVPSNLGSFCENFLGSLLDQTVSNVDSKLAAAMSSQFGQKIINEEVRPTIAFKGLSWLQRRTLLSAAQKRKITLLPKNKATNTCWACFSTQETLFLVEINETSPEKMLCKLCHGRLLSVCQFFNYLYQVACGFKQLGPEEHWKAISELRLNMFLTRLSSANEYNEIPVSGILPSLQSLKTRASFSLVQ